MEKGVNRGMFLVLSPPELESALALEPSSTFMALPLLFFRGLSASSGEGERLRDEGGIVGKRLGIIGLIMVNINAARSEPWILF